MSETLRSPRRLLVTGGAGFIGGNFAHYWCKEHADETIVVLDALTYAGNLTTLDTLTRSGQVEFIRGDITDYPLVIDLLERMAIDTVVHFAAESHVDRSIADPSVFVRANVVGTQVLLDACRRAWSANGEWAPSVRFHHVSTDEVYGTLTREQPPFTEFSPYAPNSPYAASKAGSDHLVRAYAHTFGLPATISNCSNNYGPYHFPEKLVPLSIVRALLGLALPLYGDGRQVRDWLYVEDHCVAIGRILAADVVGETFNVGGRAELENIELVRKLCAIIDTKFAEDPEIRRRFPSCPAASGRPCSELITFVRDRPGHDRRYAIDASKIESQLTFVPRHSIDAGLASTVSWYTENESWWRAVMDGSYREWILQQYGGA